MVFVVKSVYDSICWFEVLSDCIYSVCKHNKNIQLAGV